MDKFKILSILEGLIIVVLVVLLIVSRTNTKSTSDKDTTINNNSKINKEYIGIYHINNYGYFRGGNYTEVNITLNNDSTCNVSMFDNTLYNCNYEEISKDNLKISISTYIATGDSQKYDEVFSAFTLGWKLSKNKEGCEKILTERKQKYPNHYDEYTRCEKAQQDYDITLLNNGLLFENKQFTKIK